MHHLTEVNIAEPYAYRRDPSVPPFADDRPIIIFDGHCVLCSRFARFILAHDARARIRLTAAQTPLGQALFKHLGLDPIRFQTNVLLENGQARFKSDRTIRMFALLGWPWSLANLARVVPRALRDRLYQPVANHRFKWFGAQSVCFTADASQRDRFLQ
jgi:predicted DCC family thiol-disulfide oxidoreductase YuxK